MSGLKIGFLELNRKLRDKFVHLFIFNVVFSCIKQKTVDYFNNIVFEIVSECNGIQLSNWPN